MREKYTGEECHRIKELVECALGVRIKAEAKNYIDQLNYVTSDVCGYSKTVFAELKAATIAASDSVLDKAQLIERARWCLIKFETHCVE